MELSADWMLRGSLDYEYTKYTLLAYFQGIDKALNQTRVFPHLPELRQHHRALTALRDEKQGLQDQFPRNLTGLSEKHLRLNYESDHQQLPALETVDAIIDFSMPRFEHYITEAAGIFDWVENRTTVYPIGIVPLYLDEGYLFVRKPAAKATCVYEYTVSVLRDVDSDAGIRTRYVTTFPGFAGRTMEQLKGKLIKSRPEMPNPAAYAVESEVEVPVVETLLPVATKLLASMLEKGWQA